ncbi:MAG: hypothetical protein EHM70_17615 [Chloroflexota bacterium]|nr:MAG: hypothetical protein EHM70_17615 [Chloroflexota bacterium]
MSALPKRAKQHEVKPAEGWPLVVFLWMAGLGILGYVVGRIALDALPHPYHWASGLGGLVAGCAIGWLWFRVKGDVV